jgi:redox-sensing transcriptional repressor
MDDIEAEIRKLGVKAAILTIHSDDAQAKADILVKAGIRGIWNFTAVKLRAPETVAVQAEDLSSGYAMLCVTMQSYRDEDDGNG